MPNVAIVGTSRGIGRELVRQYLADGWQVHASVRKAEDAAGLDAAHIHIADMTDETSLTAMADRIGESLDLVIANAGVGAREMRIADIDPVAWTRVMTVNALGPLLVARTLGLKLKRPGGKFAALTSQLGSIAQNSGGMWAYRMSKAALNMGLANLAVEWKRHDITVSALHPGWVKTDMGGQEAPVMPVDSVAGLRKVIADLNGGGVHYRDFQGEIIPW